MSGVRHAAASTLPITIAWSASVSPCSTFKRLWSCEPTESCHTNIYHQYHDSLFHFTLTFAPSVPVPRLLTNYWPWWAILGTPRNNSNPYSVVRWFKRLNVVTGNQTPTSSTSETSLKAANKCQMFITTSVFLQSARRWGISSYANFSWLTCWLGYLVGPFARLLIG